MKIKVLSLCLVVLVFLTCCNANSISSSKPDTNNLVTGKEISIEDIYYSEKKDTYVNYYVKIRNNTDKRWDRVSVKYKVIDKNGDAIYNSSIGAQHLEAGTAEWCYFQLNNSGSYRLADAYTVVFYYFDLNDQNEDGTYHVLDAVTGDIDPKVEYVLSEIHPK